MEQPPVGPVYVYRAQATRVIDGDTFVAEVDLGFRASLAVHVRLRGVNAPEHNKPGGAEATSYLADLLMGAGVLGAPQLLLQSHKDQRSFERWICDVWITPRVGQNEPVSVADAIIASGHGKPFDPKVDKWTP